MPENVYGTLRFPSALEIQLWEYPAPSTTRRNTGTPPIPIPGITAKYSSKHLANLPEDFENRS